MVVVVVVLVVLVVLVVVVVAAVLGGDEYFSFMDDLNDACLGNFTGAKWSAALL